MDSLVFRCPGCQQPFQVLAEQAGQMVRCPSCEEPVQIPAASPPAPPAPKPPAAPTSAASTKAEEAKEAEKAEPYDCPQCEKPFGIYPSMYGSEMACPHCQQIVSLKKTRGAATESCTSDR